MPLKKMLDVIGREARAEKIHIIAHSMGNRALLGAMRILKEEGMSGLPPIREIVLAAPDIDRERFVQLAGAFVSNAERVTLYASSRDRALVASRTIHSAPRAGEAGEHIVVLPGIETVDASDVESGFLGHSYYGDSESIIADMFYLFRHSIPAAGRVHLVPRGSPPHRYWWFKPPAP